MQTPPIAQRLPQGSKPWRAKAVLVASACFLTVLALMLVDRRLAGWGAEWWERKGDREG